MIFEFWLYNAVNHGHMTDSLPSRLTKCAMKQKFSMSTINTKLSSARSIDAPESTSHDLK